MGCNSSLLVSKAPQPQLEKTNPVATDTSISNNLVHDDIPSDDLGCELNLDTNIEEDLNPDDITIDNGSTESFEYDGDDIDWNHIIIHNDQNDGEIIGIGGYSKVIRAHLKSNITHTTSNVISSTSNQISEVKVAIKIMTNSKRHNNVSDSDFEHYLKKAIEESNFLKDTAKLIGSTDHIIKSYGVAKGILPPDLLTVLNFKRSQDPIPGIGIVLRYESGGSLDKILHKGFGSKKIPFQKKMFILKGIARGIAELHAVGIVHGDIKPDNVLLSSEINPIVRLADFGMSWTQNEEKFSQQNSSLQATKHFRGTPVYCAPEMLVNPFLEFDKDITVAKSSKKTDMYAFSILCWEILAQERPFLEIKNEQALCTYIHRNKRPSMKKIPKNVPLDIFGLIELCWDKDRSKRLSAVQCQAILDYNYDLILGHSFDIFISHSKTKRPFLSYISNILVQGGYRVWFDQELNNINTASSDENNNIKSQGSSSTLQPQGLEKNISNGTLIMNGIERSTIFIACIDSEYQKNSACMNELYAAKLKFDVPKITLNLFLEENSDTWLSEEIKELCLTESDDFCLDLSHLAQRNWYYDEGSNMLEMDELNKELKSLFEILVKTRCLELRQNTVYVHN